MRNRIRHFRKMHGLTLQELADRMGTTAQTISRIERQQLRLSTDWMERFAEVLHVPVGELLEMAQRPPLMIAGIVAADGSIKEVPAEPLPFDIPAERPVIVRLGAPHGEYHLGEILVCGRFDGADIANAVGHDCVVETTEGNRALRRVIAGGAAGTYTLVPIISGAPVRYHQNLNWAARVTWRLRRG